MANAALPESEPIRKVKSWFLIAQPSTGMPPLERLLEVKRGTRLAANCSSFIHNLDSALQVVQLPGSLAIGASQNWRLRQLHIAEKISIEFDLRQEGEPITPALRKFAEESKDPKLVRAMAEDAANLLLTAVSDESCAKGSRALLQQGLVLIWGAFESLARDVFESLLNQNQSAIQLLFDSEDSRKLFHLKTIDFDTLAAFGFNLSKQLGTFLISRQDFSDLRSIKTAYGALFRKNDVLRQAFSDKGLWILSQRRHLIVHRCGIVDESYLKKTGENDELGKELVVSPAAVAAALTCVRTAGTVLIEACCDFDKEAKADAT